MTDFPILLCDGMGSVFLLDSLTTGVVIRAAFGTAWVEGKALTPQDAESRLERCRVLPTRVGMEHVDKATRVEELSNFLMGLVSDRSVSVVQLKGIMFKYGQEAHRPRDVPAEFIEQVRLEANKVVEKNKQRTIKAREALAARITHLLILKKITADEMGELVSEYGQVGRLCDVPADRIVGVQRGITVFLGRKRDDELLAAEEERQHTINRAILQPLNKLDQSIVWLNSRWDQLNNAAQCIGPNPDWMAAGMAQIRVKFGLTYLETKELCNAINTIHRLTQKSA